jgi:hypothetical protein
MSVPAPEVAAPEVWPKCKTEGSVKKRSVLAPNDLDIDVKTLDAIHFKKLTLTMDAR